MWVLTVGRFFSSPLLPMFLHMSQAFFARSPIVLFFGICHRIDLSRRYLSSHCMSLYFISTATHASPSNRIDRLSAMWVLTVRVLTVGILTATHVPSCATHTLSALANRRHEFLFIYLFIYVHFFPGSTRPRMCLVSSQWRTWSKSWFRMRS